MSKKSRYRPVLEVTHAAFIPQPNFTKNQRLRGSKRAGKTFEQNVQKTLERVYGVRVVSNAWIGYTDLYHGDRVCSPDALIIDVPAGMVTIVECKLSHTSNAYLQLHDVYRNVIKKLFPGFSVRGIEVCKHFEMGVDYPVKPNVVSNWGEKFSGFGNVMVSRL